MKFEKLKLLLLLPLLTYVISYMYLALYHAKPLIFDIIVHEGGTYTLLQVIFYASHFLGHVPVQTMLAFLFTGAYLCMTGSQATPYSKNTVWMLFIALASFLILSFILSLTMFGFEDTFSFIAQRKQQATGMYVQGGSWNLHLPSSTLLFFLVPVYLFVFKRLFQRNMELRPRGLGYILFSVFMLFLFTLVFNKYSLSPLLSVWGDPRYLAHSIRELLTFPVTYFPLPLYFLLKNENPGFESLHKEIKNPLSSIMACLVLLLLLGVCYQLSISLAAGIGTLAQKPAFTKGPPLGIPYLLASHYFEHFLDTIYFTLLCLFLYGVSRASAQMNEKIKGS